VKHHVILLTESRLLPGCYQVEEWNKTEENQNLIPVFDNDRKASFQVVLMNLTLDGFKKLEWLDSRLSPGGIALGQYTLTEIATAETAVISMFFFSTRGEFIRQMIYRLDLPELG
jgi:hypothetical protein